MIHEAHGPHDRELAVYALLILGGILTIGIVPPLLMDRLRKPGWKAQAAGHPPQATGFTA